MQRGSGFVIYCGSVCDRRAWLSSPSEADLQIWARVSSLHGCGPARVGGWTQFSRGKIRQQQHCADVDVLSLIGLIPQMKQNQGRKNSFGKIISFCRTKQACLIIQKGENGEGNKKVIVDFAKLHLIASRSFPLRSQSRLCNCRKTGLNVACKI